jgi:hypothetical protein
VYKIPVRICINLMVAGSMIGDGGIGGSFHITLGLVG